MVHIREALSSNFTNFNQNTRSMKDRLDDKKDIMITNDAWREVLLRLSLYDADGIGKPNSDMVMFYGVVFSLSQTGAELWTPVVVGQPDPAWWRCWNMKLGNYPWGGWDLSLRVEVLRIFSGDTDPGTSTGMAVVGRTQIPLPKRLGMKKGGWFQLFRLEGDQCKAKGSICLVLELLPLADLKPPVVRKRRIEYLP
ncbi:hypothetical protein L484_026369 [Morus notabilis]|uniref:Uncharacterized protein n=1 Tax=Morus notabilis TaxID=981085 RepID=W9R627_9ROSA|nr:hypothetical protein L484_026369 [Morus notabilis]